MSDINVWRDGWTDEAKAHLTKRWVDDRASAQAIADELHTSVTAVWEARARLKLPKRANGAQAKPGGARSDPATIAEIGRLLAEGITRADLGARFNLTVGQIAGIIFRNKFASPAKAQAISAGRQRQISERRAAPRLEPRQVASLGRRPPLPPQQETAVEQLRLKLVNFGPCQFPMWPHHERPPRDLKKRFCEKPVAMIGSPYCDACRRIAYTKERTDVALDMPPFVIVAGKKVLTDEGKRRIVAGQRRVAG